MAADKYIFVKLIKAWGGFCIGDVIRFGANKGQGRIDKGEGVEVPKQNAVNWTMCAKPIPEVETATKEPEAETAVRTPKKKKNKRRGR